MTILDTYSKNELLVYLKNMDWELDNPVQTAPEVEIKLLWLSKGITRQKVQKYSIYSWNFDLKLSQFGILPTRVRVQLT